MPYRAVLLIAVWQRLVYYDQTSAGKRLTLDETSILPALGDAMRGALSVRYSENIVERLARVSAPPPTPLHDREFYMCSVHQQEVHRR